MSCRPCLHPNFHLKPNPHQYRSLYSCSLYLSLEPPTERSSAGLLVGCLASILCSVLCSVVVQYRDGDLWWLWCQDSSLCRLRLTAHIQHLASSQFLKTTVATRRLAPLSQARSCFASAVSLDMVMAALHIINNNHTDTSIVRLLQANYLNSLKYHHDS